MADITEAERARELGKLGANARERIEAVQNFLAAQGAAELNGSLVRATQVEAVERLMANVRTQQRAVPAAATPSPSPASGRVTEEQYAKMGPAARLDYCRQFDQSKF
jgi:hypothetical protein